MQTRDQKLWSGCQFSSFQAFNLAFLHSLDGGEWLPFVWLTKQEDKPHSHSADRLSEDDPHCLLACPGASLEAGRDPMAATLLSLCWCCCGWDRVCILWLLRTFPAGGVCPSISSKQSFHWWRLTSTMGSTAAKRLTPEACWAVDTPEGVWAPSGAVAVDHWRPLRGHCLPGWWLVLT